MKTIYLALALTHAPEEFKKRFDVELRSLLRKSGYELLDFVGLKNGTAEDVYNHDTDCVRTADLMVAICDEPSIGLGMEIKERTTAKKPLLLCWKRGTTITRMVIGAAIVEKCMTCQYDTLEDIMRTVVEYEKSSR